MRVGAVSGDLVVKLAIGLAVVVGVVWIGRRAAGSVGDAVDAARQAAGEVLDAVGTAVAPINPASDENLAYRAANAVASSAAGRDTTVGVRIWEWLNPDKVAEEARMFGSPAPSAANPYPPPSPFNVGA